MNDERTWYEAARAFERVIMQIKPDVELSLWTVACESIGPGHPVAWTVQLLKFFEHAGIIVETTPGDGRPTETTRYIIAQWASECPGPTF